MKKILSFFTAGLLALGLIGCSGDLHNKVLARLDLSAGAVPGAFNGWDNTTPWTSIDKDNGIYTYEFDAEDAAIDWKVITVAGNWNSGAYIAKTFAAGSTDPVVLDYDDMTGGGDNAKLTGLEKGSKYRLTIECTEDSKVQVKSLEKLGAAAPDPTPFYLDGYVLEGAFLSTEWDPSLDYLFNNPTLDKKTGILTYEVKFTTTADDGYFGIVKISDGSRYHGAIELEADPIELSYTADKMTSSQSKGLKKGSPYKIIVTTAPDGTVTGQIKTGSSIKIVGVQLVNVDDTEYPADTAFAIGGAQIGWPANWTDEMAKVDANGTLSYALSKPVQLFDKDAAITIVIRPSDDNLGWAKRIAKSYQADNGDGSFSIPSSVEFDETDYIIYADLSGLKAGDDVEWKLVHPTYTISVTGLPADLNTKTMYFTGDFNGWKTPGDAATIEATVASGAISAVINLPTKDGTLKVAGKFASTDWTVPEITNAAYENAEFTVTKWPQTIKAVFKAENGSGKNGCDWTVE